MVSINTTGIASGEEITAGVFLTPLSELEAAINDLIDGTEGFTAINVDGGAIDDTAIGADTASTGAFTTLTATDGSGVQALNASELDTGTVPEARIGTFSAIDVDGGALDNVTIGANNPGNATFVNCEILTGASGLTFTSGGELASQHAVSSTNFVIQTYNSGAFTQTAFSASTTAAAIGFYGTTPTAKQTVTGSRGSNAALANLLTALANLGLITDSTT